MGSCKGSNTGHPCDHAFAQPYSAVCLMFCEVVWPSIPSLVVQRKITFSVRFFLCYRPNRLRFVLPISNHMTMPMGSFGIMPLFALMAQFCMA